MMRVRIYDDNGAARWWDVDDQTNLFVEVEVAGRREYLGSLYFDEYPDRWDIQWGTVIDGDSWWAAADTVILRKPRPERGPMTRILILCWDGDSSGFNWEPVSDGVATHTLLTLFRYMKSHDMGTSTHLTLSEISVAGYAPDEAGRERITDLIEGELQDAITLGHVGHIVARYTLEGA